MLQAPAAKTTLEVATFPSGVSTPTTFMLGRLSFCPPFFGLTLDVAIYPSIHLVQCSCTFLKLCLSVLNKNSRHRTAFQHLGTSKHSACIDEAFRNLTRDQLSNWPNIGFPLNPGVCSGETSGVDRTISGAIDPAQEVQDVQMGQQL